MTLEAFAEQLREELEQKLGETSRVELKKVLKNNSVEMLGLMIGRKDCNISPTIYINSIYDRYLDGESIEDISEELVEAYLAEKPLSSVDMDFYKDFDRVRDRICYKLIARESNRELLKQIPHIPYLDLAICFYYAYSGDLPGIGSILIQNSHLEFWNTDAEGLLALAKENTGRLFPTRFFPLNDMIQEFFGEGEELPYVPMEVLTNSEKYQGAAALLDEDALCEAANRAGSNLYILPSSIHEVILLPDDHNTSPVFLKEMVAEVNATQLEAHEILSDSVYYYDAAERTLMKIA